MHENHPYKRRSTSPSRRRLGNCNPKESGAVVIRCDGIVRNIPGGIKIAAAILWPH